jgi:hypothetical protein
LKRKMVFQTFLALVLIFCMTTFAAAAQQSDKTLPRAPGIEVGGAAAQEGTVDFPNSIYFKHNDYYNMKSNSHLTIISHFKTYQQTTEYTCGPSAAMMLQQFFAHSGEEMDIAKQCGTSDQYGTNTEQLVKYFKSLGWTVESSVDGKIEASQAMLRDNLKKGIPTMVEWCDWGGHWQVVIGYDTMGTENEADDVLIMADPYDTSDHLQDGYYTVPAQRFFYMWFDAHYFPDVLKDKPWITALPPGFKAAQ